MIKLISPKILAGLVAVLLATSCSHDELEIQGSNLPMGEYPLMFTASVEGVQSRAAGKDEWADDDAIGVRIGENGEPGQYKLTQDGDIQEAVKPLYWQNTSSSTVTAWYPCEEQKNVNITNQSESYSDFDYLAAIAKNQNYKSLVSLDFKHQMAKVRYKLEKGDGVSDIDLASATVSIHGYTIASFVEGSLTGSNSGWITPTTDCEALLIPQNMTDKNFIRVSINSKEYYYTPNENEADLQAGFCYEYTITVKKNMIEVSVNNSAVWKPGNKFDSGMTETKNYRLYLSYDADAYNEVMVSTITGIPITAEKTGVYNVSSEGCIIKYKVCSEVKPPYRRDGEFGGYATLTGIKEEEYIICTVSNISSDVSYTLDATAKPCVGDYYYSDNTYSTLLLDGKDNCSGVIFYVGPGPGDNIADYDGKLQKIHGYVLASYPAGDDRPAWCKPDYQKEFIGTDTSSDKWCGYRNTQTILKYIRKTYDNLVLSDDNYTHIYRATTYDASVAPAGTSGWYLGSAAQMSYASQIANTKLKTPISNCGSVSDRTWRYWGTSTEREQTNGNGIYGIFDIEGSLRAGYKNYGQNPRPILTF